MAFVEDLRGPWWLNDAYYRLLAGGWGKPAAPGQGNLTDAWVAGGSNIAAWFSGTPVSSAERMTFANDSVMTTKGSLSVSVDAMGVASNVSDTWIMGGGTSMVQRVIHATDATNTLIRAPMPTSYHGNTSSGTDQDGWTFGLENPSISRITYANDNTIASGRGTWTQSIRYACSTGNEEQAWIAGGNVGYYAPTVNSISRITYSNDTSNTSVRGNLSSTAAFAGASGNTTDGWIMGGWPSRTLVQRIIYANDTSTAATRTNTGYAISFLDSSGNLTDMWSFNGSDAGGHNGSAVSRTSRLTYASDTLSPTFRGNSNYSKMGIGASS